MRNLNRITNYFNRLAAWQDWKRYAEFATKAGHADLVEKYQPDEAAPWRVIDRRIGKLRAALEELGLVAKGCTK